MLEKINKQKLVVIGNGMAGIRTVEVLLDRAPDLYDITVFGSEPYGNYNRILLSPVLAGEKTVSDIMLNTVQWYEDNGITLRKGEMIEMIDRRTCEVVTAEGARVPYDRLLIATGSNPIMLPLPGKDLPGVIGFRDISTAVRADSHLADPGGCPSRRDLRFRAARHPAAGPRRHLRRRDSRPGDRRDRGAGGHDGPPGARDAAHQ